MREQLSPTSVTACTFVRDHSVCCYADADDLADTFPTWCSFCASQHQQSGGSPQPKHDIEGQASETYANNLDDGCSMFPVRVEITRETILAILSDMGIDHPLRCDSDLRIAMRFEAELRGMVRAAIRQNPGTRVVSYDHLSRRFVPDEWA